MLGSIFQPEAEKKCCQPCTSQHIWTDQLSRSSSQFAAFPPFLAVYRRTIYNFRTDRRHDGQTAAHPWGGI